LVIAGEFSGEPPPPAALRRQFARRPQAWAAAGRLILSQRLRSAQAPDQTFHVPVNQSVSCHFAKTSLQFLILQPYPSTL
jgi:hypothetical protein